MEKMTMHQELEKLRIEVEELRKQKEEREKEETTTTISLVQANLFAQWNQIIDVVAKELHPYEYNSIFY